MNKFEAANHRGDILIVDDTLSNLRVLSGMLTDSGYRVRAAPDGATALMIVQVSPPDLILLDVSMPGIDGYEVCRRLKAQAETRDIPVIFLSALDQTQDKVTGFEVGGVDYITKPFQFAEVLARVATHLSLANLQKQLERRVEERTAALTQANAALQKEIAERIRVEAERESLIVELQAQNAELEQFVYTVSHDLKTPLVTIAGFLGFLERDALAGDDERLQADIAYISDAVAGMKQVLDELLRFSRVGRGPGSSEDVPLSELAREALDVMAGKLAERGVQAQVAGELLRTDGLLVHGNRRRLLQVLQNLLDNAIKFMGDQPEPRVEIGARRDDARGMVCYVRDNGMGIDPRYHEKVFGLFDKLNPGTEGAGVGLALVKRIVEMHGGRVWIESEGVGQGSTFCFTIEDQA